MWETEFCPDRQHSVPAIWVAEKKRNALLDAEAKDTGAGIINQKRTRGEDSDQKGKCGGG